MSHCRIKYIDCLIAERNLKTRNELIEQSELNICTEPQKLPQRRRFLLGDQYISTGLLSYALGFDADLCRKYLLKSLHVNVAAFRLRGTEGAFPILDAAFDPSKPLGDPGRVSLKDRHADGARDYSMTNSRDSFWYVCLGFGIGEEKVARELATMIWDPPNADYIGTRSAVCTPNQQAIAYALKAYLEGDLATAFAMVSRVRALPKDYVGQQGQLLKSLIQGDGKGFLFSLENLLARHEQVSRRDKWYTRLYICAPALGMCVLALNAKLIAKDELPDNVYLPMVLYAAAAP